MTRPTGPLVHDTCRSLIYHAHRDARIQSPPFRVFRPTAPAAPSTSPSPSHRRRHHHVPILPSSILCPIRRRRSLVTAPIAAYLARTTSPASVGCRRHGRPRLWRFGRAWKTARPLSKVLPAVVGIIAARSPGGPRRRKKNSHHPPPPPPSPDVAATAVAVLGILPRLPLCQLLLFPTLSPPLPRSPSLQTGPSKAKRRKRLSSLPDDRIRQRSPAPGLARPSRPSLALARSTDRPDIPRRPSVGAGNKFQHDPVRAAEDRRPQPSSPHRRGATQVPGVVVQPDP